MLIFACPIIAKSQCWLFALRANTGQISVNIRICPLISVFAPVFNSQDVDIWMEIPIQHDVYIWANYSVSSYLKFIPICWNLLFWLKYDFMHIVMHHLSLIIKQDLLNYEIWKYMYPYLPSIIRICPHISVFSPVFNFRYLNSVLKEYMSKYKERWCITICIKSYFNQNNRFQHIGINIQIMSIIFDNLHRW
jgi:hypothetical protein